MNNLKKIALVSALAISSISAHAELISGDWKNTGDGLSVLDTVSGKEWIKLTETDGMSVAFVQSQLDTTFAGWRLPSRFEVYTMLHNSIPEATGISYETTISRRPANNDLMLNHINIMGDTFNGYSRGLFINDKQAEFGGTDVISSSFIWGYGAYSNNSHGDVNYSNQSLGVYLINNGGVSLSSINNPSINANSQSNANVTSVPVPATLGILGLAIAGLSFRRKSV
jgi:hypothetical protein